MTTWHKKCQTVALNKQYFVLFLFKRVHCQNLQYVKKRDNFLPPCKCFHFKSWWETPVTQPWTICSQTSTFLPSVTWHVDFELVMSLISFNMRRCLFPYKGKTIPTIHLYCTDPWETVAAVRQSYQTQCIQTESEYISLNETANKANVKAWITTNLYLCTPGDMSDLSYGHSASWKEPS